MKEPMKNTAAQAKALIDEVTAVVLPDPSADIVPLEKAKGTQAKAIKKRIDEIDMTDTGSIISFGSAAQSELQVISQAMLSDVKNKDVGPAGDSLRNMVTTIRGFSVSELDVRRKRSWWERWWGGEEEAGEQ